MLINVQEFIEGAEEKFNKLMKEWVDPIDWDYYNDKTQFTVKYLCDDIGSDRALFSGSILRHVDSDRCLYARLKESIPKKANKDNCESFFFKGDDIVMSELPFDDMRYVTIYAGRSNEKILMNFFVKNSECEQPQKYYNPLDIFDYVNGADPEPKHFSSLEYSVYDSENKLVSCELFKKEFRYPYGLVVNGEYCEYSGEKLAHAVKYNEYNTNRTDCNKGILANVLCNPEIYHYDFEYADGAVFCCKTRKYKSDEDISDKFELDSLELIKLSKYGVTCFGI